MEGAGPYQADPGPIGRKNLATPDWGYSSRRENPIPLEVDITDKLKSYITDPQVAVIVQQINSLKFNILGEVAKPGAYPLTAGTTIVDAIAIASGFKDFAKKKGIYVLRPSSGGPDLKFNFNYQEFIKGKNTKQNIMLKPRDTIIVP